MRLRSSLRLIKTPLPLLSSRRWPWMDCGTPPSPVSRPHWSGSRMKRSPNTGSGGPKPSTPISSDLPHDRAVPQGVGGTPSPSAAAGPFSVPIVPPRSTSPQSPAQASSPHSPDLFGSRRIELSRSRDARWRRYDLVLDWLPCRVRQSAHQVVTPSNTRLEWSNARRPSIWLTYDERVRHSTARR